MEIKKERNISLDFLKVIAMFMIVILHCLSKGQVLNSNNKIINDVAWLVEAFCIGATNIYVLISGYFLVDSKFKLKKVFTLCGKTWFYSIIFLIIFKIIGMNITNKELIFSIFPILTKTNYWFITVYIFMYFLSPYLNILIRNIDKKQHLTLCLGLIIFFCIVSIILPYESLIDNSFGYGIIWFITLYIFAGYIKKYVKETNKKNNKFLVMYIFFSLITMFATLGIKYIGKLFGFDNLFIERFYAYNSIFVFLSSISLFMYFRNKKINNKIIITITNFFAPLTFGIYLIHENIFIRNLLYKNIFNFSNYINQPIPIFFLIIIISALTIFTISSLIDYIRLIITKKILKLNLFNKIKNKIISYLYKFKIITSKFFKKILSIIDL